METWASVRRESRHTLAKLMGRTYVIKRATSVIGHACHPFLFLRATWTVMIACVSSIHP